MQERNPQWLLNPVTRLPDHRSNLTPVTGLTKGLIRVVDVHSTHPHNIVPPYDTDKGLLENEIQELEFLAQHRDDPSFLAGTFKPIRARAGAWTTLTVRGSRSAGSLPFVRHRSRPSSISSIRPLKLDNRQSRIFSSNVNLSNTRRWSRTAKSWLGCSRTRLLV